MSGTTAQTLWAQLADTPLLPLTLTLLAWQAAQWLYQRSGRFPLLHPVLVAILILVTVLNLTGLSYERYFAGAQLIHFLLGPATVALALPLYRQSSLISRAPLPLAVGIVGGALVAVVSAVGLAALLGASPETLVSIAPKSITAPIAMGVSETLGGLPALTVVFVIATGITGAVIGPGLLRLVGIHDPRAQGVALGVASHGIGTARALQMGEVQGAFSGLSMGLTALVTALLLPLLWPLLMRVVG